MSASRPSGELFATTRWSVVAQAGKAEETAAHAALATLCADYWFPLYAYLRRCGYAPHDAEDLTQGFFARFLRLNSLATVRREKGKFRAYLLAALKHYLADERDRANAQKRSLGQAVFFDLEEAEQRYALQGPPVLSPEQLYERQWALALLERVLECLRGEYEAAGSGAWFAALKFAMVGERNALSYAALAQQLDTTEAAIKVAVYRLRQRYRRTLRAEITRTMAGHAGVEEELRALRKILSR